jgi:NAD(P)-dependent dehydrogenase (short-subunit alcohol dehydrogenase family)
MAGRLDGKVALITGAATGIGRATALHFAREGAKVACGYRRRSADDLIEEITAAGGTAAAVKIDIADEDSIRAGVGRTVELYGRLDAAVNNAGVLPQTAPLADFDVADFDETIATDLRGVFLSMKYQIKQMLTQGGGSIINTTSVAGVIADPGMAPYVAAKHGVIGLSKAAAMDYAQQGIRVNAVAPGLVETPMVSPWMSDAGFLKALETWNPMGRIGQPHEITGIAVYLASDEASFTTAQVFLIDGGQTAH